ncbi:putative GCN5-related N-acetyltransferase [Actinoplanes missouriensis 431]|uniref:Putative GCN5-related N-acetyltransferase n=1 Tax=Actinoplanes missouriensis (strain ATCC 14538 / DSM 43046 / CBS 188.64 / JCM 3121 / NBRC 102363 / NCIMB 12654 / NRRL B-3342 / UNCC 431) TaxID=512565 RepID=I0HAG0_ACTM4|nr:GNAT family N-acetyltransferase [Actinoplanes missouriensis]BAL89997.1 putative GCN5-related N-acetyltransferase [Actinoplanes missouriensis 431]
MLKNPVWAALAGPQACFAEAAGDAARYSPEIAPFAALRDPADPAAWRDLATITDVAVLTGPSITPPTGWETTEVLAGVQMIGQSMTGVDDPDAVVLTEADVPEMLELVARAQPGPFRKRTVDLGRHLGIRDDDGRLVAMAGERFRLPGWTEVSAVCTDPEFRGKGLGARLTLAVAAGILARGELPFLHTVHDNEDAIRLYGRLGFEHSGDVVFASFRRTATS